MSRDFTAKERKTINAAWSALEYCASNNHQTTAELDDALRYETGSRTAGRDRLYAKALILRAYSEGRNGSTEARRKWLYDAVTISRGVRYGYLLACGATFSTDMESHVHLMDKVAAAIATHAAVIERRLAAIR